MDVNDSHLIATDSPVHDTSKVREILEVKQLVLGNARILYGSEGRKFFDFIIAPDPNDNYACVLVCSLDGRTRILRKETGSNALEAARVLADGLMKDTGALFMRAKVGDQLYGQQGYREEDGEFRLDVNKAIQRFSGPIDDTRTLRPDYRRDNFSRGKDADVKKRRLGDYY